MNAGSEMRPPPPAIESTNPAMNARGQTIRNSTLLLFERELVVERKLVAQLDELFLHRLADRHALVLAVEPSQVFLLAGGVDAVVARRLLGSAQRTADIACDLLELVKADELSKNALRQINVQQMSRYDAIKALVKLTREYASYESETLQKVIEARKITTSAAPTVAEINANEAALNSALSRLIAVAEQYPELKANTSYQETMQSIKGYEENVRLSRMTFNDTVTRYNNEVRVFPASLVASLLGFPQREYLAEDTSKTEYPEI